MQKKTILILSFSPLKGDPRIQRQILWLKDLYNIIHASTAPEIHNCNNHIKLELYTKSIFGKIQSLLCIPFKKFRKHLSMGYGKSLPNLIHLEADLIIANDLASVWMAFEIKKVNKNVKIIFDAHEYEPKQFAGWKFNIYIKPVTMWICKVLLPKLDAMWCVCQGIADTYEQKFGVSSTVITNAANYFKDLLPRNVDDKIKIIHHGIAMSQRKPEEMVSAVKMLNNNYSLDLMLIPSAKSYYDQLIEEVKSFSNIRLIPPVELREIPPFINNYDIGLFLLPPTTYNYKYALPNKLFEFIQARLCIVVSPNPEMKNIVVKYDLGLVAEDYTPQATAKVLQSLTPEKIMYYKNQCHKFAYELSAEKNGEIAIAMIKNILK